MGPRTEQGRGTSHFEVWPPPGNDFQMLPNWFHQEVEPRGTRVGNHHLFLVAPGVPGQDLPPTRIEGLGTRFHFDLDGDVALGFTGKLAAGSLLENLADPRVVTRNLQVFAS
jgi:hypothetical protein